MPSTQLAYLALVILCFASFIVTLAWGMWFTRERRPAARHAQSARAFVQPDADRRAA